MKRIVKSVEADAKAKIDKINRSILIEVGCVATMVWFACFGGILFYAHFSGTQQRRRREHTMSSSRASA